jgi:hypothetical protein
MNRSFATGVLDLRRPEVKAVPSTSTLQRYFAGISEYVFQAQLGVVDPQLIEYVTDLLLRFVRVDAIHKVRNLTGRPLTEVAEMLAEANSRVGSARREVHRHIGDFTLFWTGVYPEALRELRSEQHRDHFIDYCAQGKRAYFIASTMEADERTMPSCAILERLSHQFEMCAYGLREVRREWERRDDDQRALLVE